MIAWPTGQRGSWREVIAIPAALREHSNMQRIVSEVDSSTPDQREFLVGALLALAGLRGLEETVEQEIRNTPALIDILENKVLGREFKKGLQEGRQESELAILRQQIEKRFGACHHGPNSAWRARPRNNWRGWRRTCLTLQTSKSCWDRRQCRLICVDL
jgi:hypothetical protein